MKLRGAEEILFGGDYNPEQWPREVWDEDMRLMHEAGVNVVTLNVFSWGLLEPSEGVYDFSMLDEIMDAAEAHGLHVVLATSTAAAPAWMYRKHPETARVDEQGRRRHFGGRQNICPTDPYFRERASALVRQLAERYGTRPQIAAWHVSNEYGEYCHCPACTQAFRGWLRQRYASVDAMNQAWNAAFWSHTFHDFDEVVIPDALSEEFDYQWTMARSIFQGISLDYRRFMNEQTLSLYRMERDILREITPDIPVTTNLMLDFGALDYRRWGKEMDFIAWDCYPAWNADPCEPAFWHDVMRGLKGGMSYSLMEQTPSVSNWHPYRRLKRPGRMRLGSYQALAHGADTVMFFQMRQTRGCCEKDHSALIGHDGTGESRIFREMADLGRELSSLGDQLLRARSHNRVAIILDWENWWELTAAFGAGWGGQYLPEIRHWYRALMRAHIGADVIGPEDELTGYDLVLAPLLYMDHEGLAARLEAYVEGGGTFITTYMSGQVDEHGLVRPGGGCGLWSRLLGIRVEETDGVIPADELPEGEHENFFVYRGHSHPCRLTCDLMRLEGARALAVYGDDFYQGTPVLTDHEYGRGHACYMGTGTDAQFYEDFLGEVCRRIGIESLLNADPRIECTLRENEQGRFLFLLNHASDLETAVLPCAGTDLLSGRRFEAGDTLTLEEAGVALIRCE